MWLIEMSIAFVLRHPGVTSAIVGPRTMEQLEAYLPAARSSTASSFRWLAGLLMSNRALGRARDVGAETASLRQRPDSQPPEIGL
jgi:hypothetical protein